MKKPNALIHESSPYLLQHAYNPVAWEAWNETSLKRARSEDKPLLISIGYSSCHWCHVMEHECFEDSEVAEIMNSSFIPIKVDREERPDIDHIYMDALQIMTGAGGWPLNIVALPNGKPFWGATYLPKDQWKSALLQLATLYKEESKKVLEYAHDLTLSLNHINLPESARAHVTASQILSWTQRWKQKFDREFGGTQGAPKFMMPVRLNLLMHLGDLTQDTEIQNHVRHTLKSMAFGGLYDQLAGGFSRYSVDARWHVPHFEKMLYDNAQLLSLYAQAYACYGDPLFKEITSGILEFIGSNWEDSTGGYYSAYDADSMDSAGTLREGAYYSWTEQELRDVLNEEFDLVRETYNINTFGKWEEDSYVLVRRESDTELATRLRLPLETLQERLASCKTLLLARRNQRTPPRLDHKIIVSWNGLLLSGLSDAYRYCRLEKARQMGIQLGKRLKKEGDLLPHILNSRTEKSIGFLEDYATCIEGFINLYAATYDASWMQHAASLTEKVMLEFQNTESPLFYFESNSNPSVIRRTLETSDNVIPASNSIMAKNLFLLGRFFERMDWINLANAMLSEVSGSVARYSEQHTNWMQLALWLDKPFLSLALSHPMAIEQATALSQAYLPHCFINVSETPSELPLFHNRFDSENLRVYLCTYGKCLAPVSEISTALDQAREYLAVDSSI